VGDQAVVTAGHSQGHLREEWRVMSAETSRESRLLAVRALARLPLFQLSTAGMELFHTNMLYWLASERPNESAAVWAALGPTNLHVDKQSAFIRREWHHIDLVVAPGEDQPALVLENKIGAIPSPGQLDGYYAGLCSTWLPFSLELARFVLLTLTPPSFVPPEPWRSVTYWELLPALRETAQNLTGPDTNLVEAYADLVKRMDEIAAAHDPATDLGAPHALSGEERSVLGESRLLALVERVRSGRFAEIATNRLRDELGDVNSVGAGFSNGSAIYEWFVPGPAGRLFGWQIQGKQFRLAVIAANEDPRYLAGLEAMVAKLYESYFDFTLPDDLCDSLSPYRRRRPWLGYRPSFVYRYKEITPETTWNDLLSLVTWFSRHTIDFVAKLGTAT
jgi:PD-(D/E)XK nuclease superfamily protein